jgi:Phosphodiester glycosidase
VLAFDRSNRPFIGALTVTAALTGPHGLLTATRWNRPQRNAAFIVDAAWGQALDTFSRARARMLVPVAPQHSAAASPMARYRVVALSPTHGARALGDTLLLSGSNTSMLHDDDTVTMERTWSPMTPYNAVGGFPLLLRDSAIVASVDSDGSESFRGVNPRTVAGIAQNGRHLLLVVIDGRRAGYSVGTTIRETAEWMRQLGAQQAVNLDGGGSTAMVVRDRATGSTRIINRPSDALGERPVGNALAIAASQCRTP